MPYPDEGVAVASVEVVLNDFDEEFEALFAGFEEDFPILNPGCKDSYPGICLKNVSISFRRKRIYDLEDRVARICERQPQI